MRLRWHARMEGGPDPQQNVQLADVRAQTASAIQHCRSARDTINCNGETDGWTGASPLIPQATITSSSSASGTTLGEPRETELGPTAT